MVKKKRDKNISVGLNDEEFTYIKDFCEKEAIYMSSLMRQITLAYVNKKNIPELIKNE